MIRVIAGNNYPVRNPFGRFILKGLRTENYLPDCKLNFRTFNLPDTLQNKTQAISILFNVIAAVICFFTHDFPVLIKAVG